MVFNKELKEIANANHTAQIDEIKLNRKRTKNQLDLLIDSFESRLDNILAAIDDLNDAITKQQMEIKQIVNDTTLEAKILKTTADNQVKSIQSAMALALQDIPMDTYNIPQGKV